MAEKLPPIPEPLLYPPYGEALPPIPQPLLELGKKGKKNEKEPPAPKSYGEVVEGYSKVYKDYLDQKAKEFHSAPRETRSMAEIFPHMFLNQYQVPPILSGSTTPLAPPPLPQAMGGGSIGVPPITAPTARTLPGIDAPTERVRRPVEEEKKDDEKKDSAEKKPEVGGEDKGRVPEFDKDNQNAPDFGTLPTAPEMKSKESEPKKAGEESSFIENAWEGLKDWFLPLAGLGAAGWLGYNRMGGSTPPPPTRGLGPSMPPPTGGVPDGAIPMPSRVTTSTNLPSTIVKQPTPSLSQRSLTGRPAPLRLGPSLGDLPMRPRSGLPSAPSGESTLTKLKKAANKKRGKEKSKGKKK